MLVALPGRPPDGAPPGDRRSPSCATRSGCCPATAARARTRASSCARATAPGFEPDVHFQSEDYQALQGLTASGMGVALIPTLAALSVPQRRRPAPGRRRRADAAHPRGGARASTTTPRVDAAIDALRLAGRRLTLGTGTLAAVA